MASVALVLAGGASSRMGAPKQLLEWGRGTTLLAHVVEQALTWPVDEVWVVLGNDAERIIEEAGLPDVPIVINEEWSEGLASSLRVGLDALSRHAGYDLAVLALGDQPSIDANVVGRLLEEQRTTKAWAVVPKYRYTWSNPVVVARQLWPRLMSLEGDRGAQGLLKAHPEWVHEVLFEQAPPRDVDTPADVQDLRPRR